MNMGDAEDLRAEIAGLITGIAKTTAWLDPIKAGNDLDAGRAVAIIQPPSNDFETFNIVNSEWSVVVAAGPATDYLKAWERMDQLVEAMRVPLGIESAEPSAYRTHGGKEYPAYLVKLTKSYLPQGATP